MGNSSAIIPEAEQLFYYEWKGWLFWNNLDYIYILEY